jgi:antitoxin component YwqK of YwqJK toxin-antitoxin module
MKAGKISSVRLVALAALAVGVLGTEAPEPFACPDGAELRGSPPPEARKLACERRGLGGRWLHHGKAVEWSDKGVKLLEGEYRDGAMHGHFTFWNHEGKRVLDTRFEKGLPIWAPRPECPVDTTPRTFPIWPSGESPTDRSFWFQIACVKPNGSDPPIRHGPFTEWYASQHQRAEGSYQEGRQHGSTTVWYESGQMAMTGTYEEGKPSGWWAWWREQGNRRLEGRYEAGVREGRWTTFHEAGGEAETGEYREGRKSGPWTRFRKDGTKLEEAEYRNDEIHGKRNTWYENGMIEEIEEYVDGTRERTLLRVLPTGRAVPLSEAECLRHKGRWATFGAVERPECDLAASDAGRACQDRLECEGACIAPAQVHGKTAGHCSKRTIVRGSCKNFVEDGLAGGVTCVE